MKADEPGVPVVKYGMGASEQDKLVERHFHVTEEEQAITAFHFAHGLRMGPWIERMLSRVRRRERPVAPVAQPEPPEPEVAPPPDDLRRSLGLS